MTITNIIKKGEKSTHNNNKIITYQIIQLSEVVKYLNWHSVSEKSHGSGNGLTPIRRTSVAVKLNQYKF